MSLQIVAYAQLRLISEAPADFQPGETALILQGASNRLRYAPELELIGVYNYGQRRDAYSGSSGFFMDFVAALKAFDSSFSLLVAYQTIPGVLGEGACRLLLSTFKQYETEIDDERRFNQDHVGTYLQFRAALGVASDSGALVFD